MEPGCKYTKHPDQTPTISRVQEIRKAGSILSMWMAVRCATHHRNLVLNAAIRCVQYPVPCFSNEENSSMPRSTNFKLSSSGSR